ncbi:RNA degradosome polyphosphate kinase [Spirillospora sp. NPDC047279]|uniref:RNA degradosome polyphosphate kinase n=1 Tax=Spirillospora sp. NPDC047279 TaxID=3155478 RepID=UPI00340B9997
MDVSTAVPPQDEPTSSPGGELPADRFLEREESWLRFNQRVLELAEDTEVPLLERLRFLAIFSSNLDEFFSVRVAGSVRKLAAGIADDPHSARSTEQVLERLNQVVAELVERQSRCLSESVGPALADEGIEVLRWNDLTAEEHHRLGRLFEEQINPVLTPLVIDQAHPFPHVSGLSLNLAVLARDPADGAEKLSRVKMPPTLPRFVQASPGRFALLEEVIAGHLDELFTGMEILETHAFRVTRNADLDVDEEITEDLLQALERELSRRRFGMVVRLEVEKTISARVLEQLTEEFEMEGEHVYRLPGPLDLAGLNEIADLDRPELKFAPLEPGGHVLPAGGQSFAVIGDGDVLVHHPYQSFGRSVQRFIQQACADPAVRTIKQTLYRTSGDSPIVDALIEAAEAGKQVVVLMEIKARFDEAANIAWAHKLSRAGCHVVFGFVDLKTHCKLSLVVREEADGSLRRYCHIGTGNYNSSTARLYEDLGLFTCDPDIGADVAALFNHLTGFSRPSGYRRLLVSPHTARPGLLDRIQAEIDHHRAGRSAGIAFKCNSLEDEQTIDALYRASQAGVPIRLWIRGICRLRPGVAGLSETIRVHSVLGRFLEHSRVYAFGNGGDQEVWIGSADLMHRNLDRRVEALVPVTDPPARRYLTDLLDLAADDDCRAWSLDSDGTWRRHTGPGSFDIQQRLIGLHHTSTPDPQP